MKEIIKNLMSKTQWPIVNSITFGDGSMVILEIAFFLNKKYTIRPLVDASLPSYLKYNKDYLCTYDVFAIKEKKEYKVYGGEGSFEDDGFVYVLDHNEELLWFAFFTNSGPFNKIEIENNIIKAYSKAGSTWNIPMNDPINITIE